MSAHTEVVVYYLLITSRAPVVFKSKGLSIGRTLKTNSYQLLTQEQFLLMSAHMRSWKLLRLEIITPLPVIRVLQAVPGSLSKYPEIFTVELRKS